MKKFVGMLLFISAMVLGFTIQQVSALTTWKFADWQAGTGYGSKESIDSNVTNLKGELEESGGMKSGPYTKASTAKLADGITEEVYVELKSENYEDGELFEVSLALKNEAGVYVNEESVITVKTADGFEITAKGAPNFSAKITEDGVYTYRWSFKTDGTNTNLVFTVLRWDEVIATTGDIDFDTVVGPGSKIPVAAEENVSFKYLWFCNIKADNGVNVYETLPPNPNAVVQETPKKETPKEDTKAKNNPDTIDNFVPYFLGTVLGLSVLGYAVKKTISRYSKKMI